MDSVESRARTVTTNLVDFLVEVTEATERDPLRDITSDRAHDITIVWLEELPDGCWFADRPFQDVLLAMTAPTRRPEPVPPADLTDWLDGSGGWEPGGRGPQLTNVMDVVEPDTARGDDVASLVLEGRSSPTSDRRERPARVLQAFERFQREWMAWVAERREAERLRPFYEALEGAAKKLEQRDDEFELVLGLGLVRWVASDGRVIRRHLRPELVTTSVDRRSAAVSVVSQGIPRRLEDHQLFDGLEIYHPDRAPDARDELISPAGASTPAALADSLGTWLAACLDTDLQAAPGHSHHEEPGEVVRLSLSPALILRPRSKAQLAEAYKEIAKQLRTPDAPVPVALAQLIMDTEPDQRRAWIAEQGKASGDFLGDDPRFPLEANQEQASVMDLLRRETAVVVQGPPGTGKTHTIANLVCALLARGQRVLVTSQKDQALRVLRDKIPAESRHLCVLLAGGSKNAAAELKDGLDALSDAVATSNTEALRARIQEMSRRREMLKRRASLLNAGIRELRQLENETYSVGDPASAYVAYNGTLADIARRVKREEPRYQWFPPLPHGAPAAPPFAGSDVAKLRGLLAEDTPARQRRIGQWIPRPPLIPPQAIFADLVSDEVAAERNIHAHDPLVRDVARLSDAELAELTRLRSDAARLFTELGMTVDGGRGAAPDWVAQAVEDHLAGRSMGLWRTLHAIRDEPARLLGQVLAQGVGLVVMVDTAAVGNLGTARGALDAGRALAVFLRQGGKLRKRFASTVQKQAGTFQVLVQVNGQAPETLEHVTAAVHRLEAEVAALQLAEAWAECGVQVTKGGLKVTLSDLCDKSATMAAVQHLAGLRSRVTTILFAVNLQLSLSDPMTLAKLLSLAPAAAQQRKYEQARAVIETAHRAIADQARHEAPCPEVADLLTALRARDTTAYVHALESLHEAIEQQSAATRQAQLTGALSAAHPALTEMLRDDPAAPHWDERLADLPAAWAWRAACQFIESKRTAERERQLTDEYTNVESEIKRVTQQLAGAEAMLACLERMTDGHARALRSYREHMSKVGAGSGARVKRFQAAAREAMQKAKGAVPAWVVPLPNLLDNLSVDRNSFDVVIVDEASQVGVEHLYLLWLAPRVIVVGDDKQCTPGENRLGGHERIFANLDRYLDGVDQDIRVHFTPKSDLYGMLSARSGKNAVIRLREHFRCVPEIIGWSSTQFYAAGGTKGLIPLREHVESDLEPLQVRYVPGAFPEGRNLNLRNPVEAKAIADELALCIADPQYEGKTLGVVVLQGRGQVRLLEHEINARVTPEQRIDRQIRVGIPSDFQGDERDVIFLSMVVAEPPRAQKAPRYQQAFNVAASRAKDQLWLFLSVRDADLKHDDLRASLLGYMRNPPSTYGPSPALEAVSETDPCQPFESMLEQRVFREIRGRGYHVVPQYEVGTKTLDLVVVGSAGRLAVECDGHYWHTSPAQTDSDARRDRDLRRMGWDVVRVRESEFEFDRSREMARVWAALTARGIEPAAVEPLRQVGSEAAVSHDWWAPVDLSDADDETEDLDD